MNKFPKRNDMVKTILQTVSPINRTERISFCNAYGRVTAEDIFCVNTLPNYPVSRFDGIAVRYSDFENGMPETTKWTVGKDYVYCNTGTAIPEGYDTVVVIEEVKELEEGIKIGKGPKVSGDFVNDIGCNMREGEKIISKGENITPGHVGLFASGGISEISVIAKPRVAIIPTGDELVSPTDNVPQKKNIESNSYMIASYIDEWGGESNPFPIIKDVPELIIAALNKACEENDAVVIIAGSSLGTKDFTLGILNKLGEVIVPELAHGPGRKSSLSVLKNKPVLGVAGPPLGAQITCDLYLKPFMSRLSGQQYVKMSSLEVISDDEFIEYDVDFNERVHIYKEENEYHIRSIFSHKTTRSQMNTLGNGNFYRVAGSSLKPGDRTTVELLRPVEYVPDHDMLPEVLEKEGTYNE